MLWRLQEKGVFQTQQDCHMNERANKTVAGCIGPAQVQVRQGPSIVKRQVDVGSTHNQEAVYN